MVRQRIPEQFSDDFWNAARLWSEWKRNGWPYTGGWYDSQPAQYVDIISAFESEAIYHDNKKREGSAQPTLRSVFNGNG